MKPWVKEYLQARSQQYWMVSIEWCTTLGWKIVTISLNKQPPLHSVINCHHHFPRHFLNEINCGSFISWKTSWHFTKLNVYLYSKNFQYDTHFRLHECFYEQIVRLSLRVIRIKMTPIMLFYSKAFIVWQ